ncbi:hypothetical protein FSP39_016694 [Pinctada imbricata]|uniref:Uncharacterized protein n=1 Tax=Pinctada imbricata TaxID=66713 RepID=A0AA89BWP1_PINIB|nr:hypothetical protein FSP39_016694 [Pinctada imbricata]
MGRDMDVRMIQHGGYASFTVKANKLTQEHEIDKQKYNQTLIKRLDECQQHSQISNITRSHENAPKEINFYILIASIAVVGLCIALFITLFLGRKLWRTSLAQRKGNRHGDPESPHLLMFDKHEEDDKFTTMTPSVQSDDTYTKTVSGSEISTEREYSKDSNNPEETISCFTDQRRDLLRGIPPVQESSEIQEWTSTTRDKKGTRETKHRMNKHSNRQQRDKVHQTQNDQAQEDTRRGQGTPNTEWTSTTIGKKGTRNTKHRMNKHNNRQQRDKEYQTQNEQAQQ